MVSLTGYDGGWAAGETSYGGWVRGGGSESVKFYGIRGGFAVGAVGRTERVVGVF